MKLSASTGDYRGYTDSIAETLGIKPRALASRAREAILRHYGKETYFRSGSTDCNLPLSMGIPAISIGCVRGAGAHTRDEYIEEASLLPGIGVAMEMILHHI